MSESDFDKCIREMREMRKIADGLGENMATHKHLAMVTFFGFCALAVGLTLIFVPLL